MRNKFADTLYEIGRTDPRICALVADISPAGSMVHFREEFPERFINTGVAEQSMIGIAAGLALNGMRPFCYTIATFSIFRPFEMVRVDLAYQNLPVTVIGMGAGAIYSTLGGTHHTLEDVAVASSVPNMTVLAPCDPEEMRAATRWCATESTGPVYMRLGKAGEPDLTGDAVDPFVIGKVRYLTRGTDVALVSYGITMAMMGEAAEALREQGLSVSLITVNSIKPLDVEGIREVLNAHKTVVVAEEHVPHGGLGSRVKEVAWESQASCRLRTLSLQDRFLHVYGDHKQLLEAHGLTSKAVIEAALG